MAASPIVNTTWWMIHSLKEKPIRISHSSVQELGVTHKHLFAPCDNVLGLLTF